MKCALFQLDSTDDSLRGLKVFLAFQRALKAESFLKYKEWIWFNSYKNQGINIETNDFLKQLQFFKFEKMYRFRKAKCYSFDFNQI